MSSATTSEVRATQFAIVPIWLIEVASGSAVKLYALLAGRYANTESEAWPSRKTLARAMHTHPNTISNLLQELEQRGAITRETRMAKDGSRTSDLIMVHPEPRVGMPQKGAVTTDCDTPLTTDCEAPSQPIVTLNHTQLNHTQVEPKEKCAIESESDDPEPHAPASLPFLFGQFWRAYPKEGRRAKQTALKAWEKLNPDQTLFQEIMRGLEAERLARSRAKARGEFYPHPAHATTWLNQRRWEDSQDDDPDGGGAYGGFAPATWGDEWGGEAA